MKTYKRFLGFLLAAGITAACLSVLSACVKNIPAPPKTETPENNPLYAYSEIREFNYNSRIPYILGSGAEEIGKTFDRVSGTLNHSESYRSEQNTDLTYTLSRLNAFYGNAAPALPTYVTGITIMPENKLITPIGNGQTKVEYITSRTVLGVRLGDNIKSAEAIFKKFGYNKIYEEIKKSNLPMSREFTFRNGILLISCAVEVKNEISFMRVWIPMRDEAIETANAKSNLPAALGLMYSVYANPDFAYDSKTQTERIYKHKDGITVCRLRGFPDAGDMIMNADVYFESNKYDVFGVKTGMTLTEAGKRLSSADCIRETDFENTYSYGNVFIKLRADGNIVKAINVSLAESTHLPDLRDNGK